MTLTSGSIEGKQLDLCKRNTIFCHVDCFCLQERKKGRRSQKYFSVSKTEATASAKTSRGGGRIPHPSLFRDKFSPGRKP